MKELVYQVKFLSDIVLPATSNNEGNISDLDFIPGSNFLGMVALNYDTFEDSFKLFHSGAVKFGDANILKDDKQTYKMPLSYFHKKLDDTTLYNHHFLEDKDFKAEDKGGLGQLKQKRDGYITKDKKQINIDYNYSQKSAYNKDTRTSKDGQMYGYNAIQSGTTWQFSIKIDENISSNDLELLKQTITGKKRLGKSKSAQYGLVEIKEKGQVQNIEDKNSNEIILYANSRLALVDKCGNPTYDLKYLFEGLTEKNIDYPKCQIRTSTFTPYNSKRETKDYERVCIQKGSVIVLTDVKKEDIPSFVGACQSEGFGEILLNPSFLNENRFNLVELKKNTENTEKTPLTTKTALFLQQREENKKAKLDLGQEVAKFINTHKDKYPNKMNSQWGTIRSLCSKDTTKTIYEEVEEYISKGLAKTKWEGDKKIILLNAIKNSNTPLAFTKLLSIQMPKIKENKEPKDDK